ncbi:MAG: hypothetical protein VX519_02655, partial [Myxococcota bacterium]|nr:hypothetical protein [Myxococcota bacterium]
MILSSWLLLLQACGTGSDKPVDSAPPIDTDTPEVLDCGGAEDFEEDWHALTEGIGRIPLDGAYPSRIVAFGERAFPVILDGAGHSIVAAARYGEGHVLHVGHEGLIGGALQTARGVRGLIRNTLAWMGPENPQVGLEPGQEALAAFLRDEGHTPVEVTPSELQEIDIYIRGSSGELSEEESTKILEHVEAGGGLFSGGHAWYWGYSNENAAENHPGNHVLVPMGLLLTTAYSESATHVLPEEAPSNLSHPSSALQAIL